MTAAGLAVAIPAVLAYNVFGADRGASRPSWKVSRRDSARRASWPGPRQRGARDLPEPDMAFGRLERNPGAQPMSDINMTPLIDVMLVLLVIFIITAPLMTSSLKLDLPQPTAAAASDAPAFVALAIDAQGRLYLDDEPAGARGDRRARARGRAPQPRHRGAVARRPARALRPRGRAHRLGAGRRADAHRLRAPRRRHGP